MPSHRSREASHYVARLDTPVYTPALIDAEPEYSPSLAARFPSALRNKAQIVEAAALAYHFWESMGCPRRSSEEESSAPETAAAK
jgi:hypothetical protein